MKCRRKKAALQQTTPKRTFAFVARDVRCARSQPANALVRDKLISLSKTPKTVSITRFRLIPWGVGDDLQNFWTSPGGGLWRDGADIFCARPRGGL